jgi:rhodanese-related sulfurtransferase
MDEREPELISAEDAWRLVQEGANPVFLDTRNAKHWGQSDVMIPEAVHIWRGELAARINEVPRGRTVVTYCTCHKEHSSTVAARILLEQGYRDVHPLAGGMNAWRDKGYPLVPKKEEERSALSSQQSA